MTSSTGVEAGEHRQAEARCITLTNVVVREVRA